MKPLFTTLLIILCLALPAAAQDIIGRVVSVADGDTITVLQNNKQYKIRLYGIDCPESGQAFGKKAKQFTSSKTYGKTVSVKSYDTDKYGRTVGVVISDDENVNHALI